MTEASTFVGVSIPPSSAADDPRFTMVLLIDVHAVLKKHGYVQAENKASHADVLVDLLHMVWHFEGVHS